MKRSFLLVVVSAVLAGAAFGAVPVGEVTSTVNDKVFKAKIEREKLQRAPVWNEDDPNPPLSAREAMRLARNGFAAMGLKDGDWDIAHMNLTHVRTIDRWYYVVSFHRMRYRDRELVGVDYVQFPVLFDKHVVVPKPDERSR